MSHEERAILAKIAMGGRGADVVIIGGSVVNVYTGEIVREDVAIGTGRIALVGDVSHCIRRGTEIIDARGMYLAPGFLDAHIHLESTMLTLSEFARVVVPRGTTGVFADPHEIANVLGGRGIKVLVDEAKRLPLRVFVQVPSCVPSAPGLETVGAEVSPEDVGRLFDEVDAVALAEVMNYPGVIRTERDILEKIRAALSRRKPIEGHAPLLRGAELNAYIALGVSSDHEVTRGDEALEKLRRGMWVEAREGSTARDLAGILRELRARDTSLWRVTLCTDDRHPDDLIGEGHMDHAIRRAIEEGVDPIDAIRMATINVAVRFGMDLDIGGIAPGRFADIVFLSDLKRVKVEKVMVNGEIVAVNGRLIIDFPRFEHPQFVLETVRIKRLSPDDLIVRARGEEGKVKVRVIGVIEGQLVTKHLIEELPVDRMGAVIPDPNSDIAKIAVIERHGRHGGVAVGFVKGFGMKRGAIGSTVAHDAHNVVVVGMNDGDMIKAASSLSEAGGGLVAVSEGRVIGMLSLPIAGLMSRDNAEKVADKIKVLEDAARKLGITMEKPFMQLSFLSLPVIPELKITDKGLFDVNRFKFVDVVVGS